MVATSRHRALSPPSPSRQSPSVVPPPLPFSFRHPLVYATKAEQHVIELEDFILEEVAPKILRLRDEYDGIEQQMLHRNPQSMHLSHQQPSNDARNRCTSQRYKMKQQAWAWKKTSKKQELKRWEGFLDLSMEFQKLSTTIHPKLLLLTVLWQRSQSIAPNSYVPLDTAAAQMNKNSIHDKDLEDNGFRTLEQKHLWMEYRQVCTQNVQLSRCIQEKLKEHHCVVVSPASSPPPSFVESTRSSREEASFWASLKTFYDEFCVCKCCQGMFHQGYLKALIVKFPSNDRTDVSIGKDSSVAPSFLCIHCWNEQALEQKRKDETCRNRKSSSTSLERSPPNTSKDTTVSIDHRQQNRNNKPRGCRADENRSNEQPKIAMSAGKTPLFESARWKARKKVIQDRMAAASSNNRRHTQMTDSRKEAKKMIPSTEERNSCSESSRSNLTETQTAHPPCTPQITAEDPPRIDPLASIRFKMNSSAVQTKRDGLSKDPTINNIANGWSRYGSSESSICSNSLVESQSVQSPQTKNSDHTRSCFSDESSLFGTIVSEESWSSFHTRSVFSMTSSLMDTTTLSEDVRRPPIKSAMKKMIPADNLSSLSVSTRSSPTKVQDFPDDVLSLTSTATNATKKSVRFQHPLEEHCILNDSLNASALLDTSAEIMEKAEYFCNCDSIYETLEKHKII